MPISEIRQYKRIPFVGPVRYSVTVSDIGRIETIHNVGVSMNVSEGGLGMITDYSLKEGHVLIFEDEIKINKIVAKASIVRWARKIGDDRFQVGSEFVR